MTDGAEWDRVRDRLYSEIVVIRDTWRQYQFLFATGPERVTMLNHCAGWFFGTVQRTFLREVILGISRLTDPAKNRAQANLTVRALLDDPYFRTRRRFFGPLSSRIDTAVKAATDVRTHRHKYIAHLDHGVAIGKSATPVPGLKLESVSQALGAIEDAFKYHSSRVRKVDSSFGLDALRSVESVILILEQSDRWRRFMALDPEDR
jgi:hypothetical protein